jgi:hypothetical protein
MLSHVKLLARFNIGSTILRRSARSFASQTEKTVAEGEVKAKRVSKLKVRNQLFVRNSIYDLVDIDRK